MANIRVRLLQLVKLEIDGKIKWTKCPVVLPTHGKSKLGAPTIANKAKILATGAYYIDYRVSGIRKVVTVQSILEADGREGVTTANITDQDVTDAIGKIERRLDGFKNGDKAAVAWAAEQVKGLTGTTVSEGEPTIAESIKAYLKKLPAADKSKSTINGYTTSLEYFENWCNGIAPGQKLPEKFKAIRYVSEIAAATLQDFYGYLAADAPNQKNPAKPGLSATTRNSKLGHIRTWLTTAKVRGVSEMVNEVQKAPNDSSDVSPYSDEVLAKLFAKCSELGLTDQAELYQFDLGTGMRSGEIVVAEYTDIRRKGKDASLGGFIQVEPKPHYDWEPKTMPAGERLIPISGALLTMLDRRRARMPDSDLIFPITEGLSRPTSKFYSDLKVVGRLAGIACGTCVGCRTEGLECRQVYMHKFRHTFACNMLWNWTDENGVVHAGQDIKTVAKWLGHSNTNITQRYLEAAPDAEGLAFVNTSRVNQWLKEPKTVAA
jgi:integrase